MSLLEGEEQIIVDQPEENSYSRLQRLSNMDNDQVRKNVYSVPGTEKPHRVPFLPILAVIIFTVFYVSPIFPLYPTAQSCLAILVTAAFCWGTECIPSYATAYFVPAAAVWLRVGYNESTGERIPTKDWAVELAQRFTDPIIFVFLGSLTISAALAKLQITDRVSAFIIGHISPKPKIILGAIMLLNFVVAAFLSNVASTTLVLTFSLPIIRSLDPEDPFIRAMLFGMAWSGNCGGMPTTIASPQNILAVGYINENNPDTISFVKWMAFAFPSALVILICFWVYLILRFKPARDEIPRLSQDQQFDPWSWRHTLACITTIVTIVMWALNEQFATNLGHVGITSLLPVMVFFSCGILDGHDFGTLRWSTLVLMGGGLALGEAMTKSGLLQILSDYISKGVKGVNQWVVLLIILAIEAILTSVINHTSAAAILFPVLKEIGAVIGAQSSLLTISAMMISCSQLFHISSFPNALISGVQKHYRLDSTKLTSESFLTGTSFFLVGWPTVLMAMLILLSVAYGIVKGMKLDK